MDLVIQEYIMQEKTRQLKEEGYLLIRNFFPKNKIDDIREKSELVFKIQFERFGYKDDYKTNKIRLFNEHPNVFINCGKIIQQGLIELYSLSVDDKLIDELKSLGLEFPNLCTRPVLFFNHPRLAKEERYYKTPLHQDWPSMKSSSDSLVVWVPLVDITKDLGPVIFYPGTHTLGDISDSTSGGFATIENYDLSEYNPIQPEINAGDVVIFSTFLVHKSGDIINDEIRWSCHLRYTNMMDKDFIGRDFPNPYVYKPEIQK